MIGRRNLARRLARARSGVAMVELAISLPFLLVAGLWGAELANFTHANMRLGQIAIQIADNASRIGDTSTLQERKIYESDLNDLIYGAHVHGGGLNLYEHGRVIISSLEVQPGTSDTQWIHWQRCRGMLKVNSSYGKTGDTLGTDGIGPTGQEVQALSGDAVIFVEITYEYQPLVTSAFIGRSQIRTHAAFNVRDDRDLSQIYQRNPGTPDPVQDCATFTGTPKVADGSVS